MYKKGLVKKISLISKFMASQPGKETITVHILSNISRRKGDQTMKFGQSIDMISIFLETLCTKCGGETFPDPSLKK